MAEGQDGAELTGEQQARRLMETRIVRSNHLEFTCRPEPGQNRPSGFTCWGPESGSCRTMHISRESAERCTDTAARAGARRDIPRDFGDREPVALYRKKHPRGPGK